MKSLSTQKARKKDKSLLMAKSSAQFLLERLPWKLWLERARKNQRNIINTNHSFHCQNATQNRKILIRKNCKNFHQRFKTLIKITKWYSNAFEWNSHLIIFIPQSGENTQKWMLHRSEILSVYIKICWFCTTFIECCKLFMLFGCLLI